MLESYKGRELKEGQKVEVYFHLRKKVFSVRDAETGLVVAHGNNIYLVDAEFEVSEAGRQRVLAEQRKNVHAHVSGTFAGCKQFNTESLMDDYWVKPYYNPYTTEQFMVGQHPFKSSSYVWLSDKQVWAK